MKKFLSKILLGASLLSGAAAYAQQPRAVYLPRSSAQTQSQTQSAGWASTIAQPAAEQPAASEQPTTKPTGNSPLRYVGPHGSAQATPCPPGTARAGAKADCTPIAHKHYHPKETVNRFHITIHRSNGETIEKYLSTPKESRGAIPTLALDDEGNVAKFDLCPGDYIVQHGDADPNTVTFWPTNRNKGLEGVVNKNDYTITSDEVVNYMIANNTGGAEFTINKKKINCPPSKQASGAAKYFVSIPPNCQSAASAQPTQPQPTQQAPEQKKAKPKGEAPKPYTQISVGAGPYHSDNNAVDQNGVRYNSLSTSGIQYVASVAHFGDKNFFRGSGVFTRGNEAYGSESVQFNEYNAMSEKADMLDFETINGFRRRTTPTIGGRITIGTVKHGINNQCIGVLRDYSTAKIAPMVGAKFGHFAGTYFSLSGGYMMQLITTKEQESTGDIRINDPGPMKPYKSYSTWEGGPIASFSTRIMVKNTPNARAYFNAEGNFMPVIRTISTSAGWGERLKGSDYNGAIAAGYELKRRFGVEARFGTEWQQNRFDVRNGFGKETPFSTRNTQVNHKLIFSVYKTF
jgi:hypothetical protein